MRTLYSQLRPAVLCLSAMTVLTGLLYPAVITAAAQLLFPGKANGSLLLRDGKVVGSELIGQGFSSPRRFWGRLSATSPFPCDAAASSGSNLGPSNPALVEAVRARAEALRRADPGNTALIPVDLVTASGSGLDPHISPAAAMYQVPRVARENGLVREAVEAMLRRRIEERTWIWGEPRVNVLLLNLDLDSQETPARGKISHAAR